MWGCDLDSKHLAFAFVHYQTGEYFTCSTRWRPKHEKSAPGLTRQAWLARDAVSRFGRIVAKQYPACSVDVELPTGRFPSPSLSQQVGVVGLALHDIHGFEPSWLSPADWKKRVGLSGDASKAMIALWAVVSQGARADLEQDQYDALGVAYSAALRMSPELRLRPLDP